MNKILYYILNFTWGIIQNIVGFVTLIVLSIRHKQDISHYFYKGALITNVGHYWGGISLGMFVFVAHDEPQMTVQHEWGHTIQSIILGPLYLLVIGLPSIIWNKLFYEIYLKSENGYYKFWTERWADKLGGVDRDFS